MFAGEGGRTVWSQDNCLSRRLTRHGHRGGGDHGLMPCSVRCTKQTGLQGPGRGTLKPRGRNTAPEVCDSSCQRPGPRQRCKNNGGRQHNGRPVRATGQPQKGYTRAKGEGLPDTLVEDKCTRLTNVASNRVCHAWCQGVKYYLARVWPTLPVPGSQPSPCNRAIEWR